MPKSIFTESIARLHTYIPTYLHRQFKGFILTQAEPPLFYLPAKCVGPDGGALGARLCRCCFLYIHTSLSDTQLYMLK